MLVLGMISGTSHDAVDGCLVDFTQEGTTLTARIVETSATPYPDELRARLVAALPPAPVSAEEVCRLDTAIGHHLADIARDTVARHRVDLVSSHGQTVFHWVEEGRARGTLQLGQPAWVAEAAGVPVLSDLRAADLAAGGQGAPLVPVLDLLLLEASETCSAALNLGGIANLTVVPPDGPPFAYDVGPANTLIDAAVHRLTGGREHFDRDGAYAASGHVDPGLLTALLADPYYAAPLPKSTGKEHFNAAALDRLLAERGRDLDTDVVATVTELTARVVAADVDRHGVERVVASGGGVANPVLWQRMQALTPGVEWSTSDTLGVPSDAKEAFAFALIGYLSAHRLPGNVPSCTGARGPRVLGTLTAGAALDAPLVPAPTRLVLA